MTSSSCAKSSARTPLPPKSQVIFQWRFFLKINSVNSAIIPDVRGKPIEIMWKTGIKILWSKLYFRGSGLMLYFIILYVLIGVDTLFFRTHLGPCRRDYHCNPPGWKLWGGCQEVQGENHAAVGLLQETRLPQSAQVGPTDSKQNELIFFLWKI